MKMRDVFMGCYCLEERRAIEGREDVTPQRWCDEYPECQKPDQEKEKPHGHGS